MAALQFDDLVPQQNNMGGTVSFDDLIPASPQAPDYLGDIEKSAASGLARGIANAAVDPIGFVESGPRFLANRLGRGLGGAYEAIADKAGLPPMSPSVANFMTYPAGGDPNSETGKLNSLMSEQVIPAFAKAGTGMDMNYQPQTKPGEYAASIGSAIPSAGLGLSPLGVVGMGTGAVAGKDLASLFTDNPQYQQAASELGGLAGGAGGMGAAKPIMSGLNMLADNDIGTNLPGILGDTKSGRQPGAPEPSSMLPTYSPEQMKAAAIAAYDNSEKIGGQIPINNMRQTVSQLASNKDINKQTARGQTFAGDSPVTNALGRLQDAVKDDSPWTTADANDIDDSIRNDIAKARSTGDYDSARKLTIIKNSLRDTYKDYAQQNPQQAAGFNEWIRGDKLYSAASNAQDMADMIQNAQRADVPSTAIKNAFKNFTKDDDNKIGLTNDEWDAANHAAEYGVITPILKTLGSRMSGHIAGGLAGFAEGGLTGGVGGYLVGNAVAAPFRWMANAKQAGRAQNVPDLISQRPVVQEALNPAYPSYNGITPEVPIVQTPEPAPRQPLALPAPVPRDAALVPAEDGTLRPQTPDEYWQGMLAARKAKATGLTPDVASAQASNDLKMAQQGIGTQSELARFARENANQPIAKVAWKFQQPENTAQQTNRILERADLNKAEREAAIAKQIQMEKLFQDNVTPPKEIIENAAQRFKDAGIPTGSLGDALIRLLEDQKGSVSIPQLFALRKAIADFNPNTLVKTLPATFAAQNNQPPAAAPFNPAMSEAFKKAGVQNQPQQPQKQANQPQPQAEVSNFFSKVANAESGNNPNAKNKGSSASGLMQFTDGTWNQMVKRYGPQTGITLADKNDPKAQEVMARLYAKDNIARMQPFLKRNPTKGELYSAHVLGADGALRLINAANNTPGKQAILLFPQKVTLANKNLFFDKAGNPVSALKLYQTINNRV